MPVCDNKVWLDGVWYDKVWFEKVYLCEKPSIEGTWVNESDEEWYDLDGCIWTSEPYTPIELLCNSEFDFGLNGWHFDPKYTAELTDNGDGSIHLKTTSNYGSVVPNGQQFPNDSYVLEIEVANVSGNGKMSIRDTANNWHNLKYFTAAGRYSVVFTGGINDIHCGASNDANFECDFLSYSLKINATEAVTFNGETVTFNNEEVTF
jgi:hypothetical protein